MKKPKISMLYSNEDGYDSIKIRSKDPSLIIFINQYLVSVGLTGNVGQYTVFITKYTLRQIFECLMKTRSVIDWEITGKLMNDISCLLPSPDTPKNWEIASIIKDSQIIPTKIQIAGINKITSCPLKGFILNDDFGVGKTLQAILSVVYFQKKLKSATILCPKYLKTQWAIQISKAAPSLEYSIFSYDEKIINPGKIIIVDEAHLVVNAPKRYKKFSQLIKNADKVIILTGADFDQDLNCFERLIKLSGLSISRSLLKKHLSLGVKNLIEVIPSIESCYLRRTSEESRVKTPVKTIELAETKEVHKINKAIVTNSSFGNRESLKYIEILSSLKIEDVIKYISAAKRSSPSCTIAVYSQFIKILNSLKSKLPDSVYFNERNNFDKLILCDSSKVKDGTSIDADISIIIDPFLDARSNRQIETRSGRGSVVKIVFHQGYDKIAFENSRFMSKNRNIEEHKLVISRILETKIKS